MYECVVYECVDLVEVFDGLCCELLVLCLIGDVGLYFQYCVIDIECMDLCVGVVEFFYCVCCDYYVVCVFVCGFDCEFYVEFWFDFGNYDDFVFQ